MPESEIEPVRSATTAKVFAAVGIGWLITLVGLLILYWRDWWILDDIADPVGGLMPLIVPWAGALGGVTISLMGTAKHSRDWDDTWNLWHALRPFLGAVAGSVAFLIVVIVLRLAGGMEDADERLQLTPVSVGLFFVIAFSVGFRDKLFLDLLSKVVSVLFANGDPTDEQVTYALNTNMVDFGNVDAGTTATSVVRVTLTSAAQVELADNWKEVTGADATAFAVQSRLDTLGSSRDLAVDFTPQEKRGYDASLVTVIGEVRKEVPLRGVGVAPAKARGMVRQVIDAATRRNPGRGT